jgi:hypothetical protein
MKRDFGKPHQNNPILKLTFEFSLKIIELAECLEESKKYVVANQILKSGTSIGANIHEAQNAESKLDFIHKFKIAKRMCHNACTLRPLEGMAWTADTNPPFFFWGGSSGLDQC